MTTAIATGETRTLPEFAGVTTRLLDAAERRFQTGPAHVPLVIEDCRPDRRGDLREVLARHARGIRTAIYEHGAILLRGFAIEGEREFEQAISSIDGMRPMSGYFMAEAGRERVAGTDAVFPTNTNYKTGGSFFLGGFHSENYYSPDVPAFQSFWCKQEPSLGGETALVFTPNVYDELSPDLRARIEREPFCATRWPLADIAARYRAPVDRVHEFFVRLGFPIVSDGGERFVALFKPSVFRHPYTGRPALQMNLSLELPGLDPALRPLVAPHYTGRQWAVHRFGWRHPATWKALYCLHHVPTILGHRRALVESIAGAFKAFASRRRRDRSTERREPAATRLANVTKPEDVRTLASAVWRQCLVFPWRRNDVLVLDNLQVLHAGMPGFGARELRVMICNPIPLSFQPFSGLVEVSTDESYETVEARFQRFLRSAAA